MIINNINNYKENLKSIKDYWVNNPCEEWFFGPGINCKNPNQINLEEFNRNSFLRYSNEPEILKFTDFNLLKDLNVLEVGYGLGSDAVLLAKSSKNYFGTDLSEVSYEVTSRRLKLYDLKNTNLKVGSSTNLDYEDSFFDFVYSWGVIHHSGNIKKSLEEIYRVLKKGGRSKIMVYNKDSLIVFIYWLYYSIKEVNFKRTRAQIISENIESPGTLILSKSELKELVNSVGFKLINLKLYRDFFYILRKYPRYIRPLIRISAKFLSLLLGGEKKIGYFMCAEIIK
jgi:ubiquinone/menaquinone biosynthesis C-methylase UbiE